MDVASKVAAAIAQPYGIIAKSLAASPPPDDVGVPDCTLRYLPNIVAENRKRNLSPKDRMPMIVALRRAGLPVPSATDVEAEVRLSDAYTANRTRTLQ
ncbi:MULTISPECIES: hypothetical protein [Rhizobium]|uniref:hypothetical protein n=1 Tax=Rhizobium TaxID=379 RepID=UPI001FF04E1E|nr:MULTISPECIES: hypothetical protein [Rhizobium]